MINIKRILVFTLIFFLTKGITAQKLTNGYIHQWIRYIEPSFEYDKNYDLYVINGIVIFDESLESELSKYDIRDSNLNIDYLDMDRITSFFHRPVGAIIIITSHNKRLKRRKVKALLVDFREKLLGTPFRTHHINDTLKQPVLLIDGTPIHHNEAAKVLGNLKTRDIFNMAYTSKAPIKYYGQNAKNGLIQIWLKEKK